MREKILGDLLQKGLIASEDAEEIERFSIGQPFSLHWELKLLLYLGVILLNAGLGFIIYENIDGIGHAAIITLIGAISAGCFWYAIRHRRPFTLEEVESPTPYFDYILLLGCLTFLLMENPEKAILHTLLVERNGYLHALLAGTPLAENDDRFFGDPVYRSLIGGP